MRAAAMAVTVASVLLAPGAAAAQTTVLLNAPDTQVTDAVLRGGAYANTVYNTDTLITKASGDSSLVRRALLKFDTDRFVPSGATVSSATLTLTLKKSDPESRRLGIYHVKSAFQESQATWYTRKTGYDWTQAGGDLGSKYAEVTVGTSAGSKVTIDVTSLVQATVKGSLGSRYTRVALVDIGAASKYAYKEYHSSEASDPSVRPVLKVVYGGTTTNTAPSTTTSSTTTSTSRLRVLHWNTHYGVGTDGKYNIDRIATWIVKMNPHLVSLNEVTRYSHYNTSDDQPARYAALLKAKTGVTWYYTFRVDSGASTGVGNLVLSRFPIDSKSSCQLSSRRVAVHGSVVVNGRRINFWSTHLDSSDGNSLRIAEVKNLTSCLNNFAQQRIVSGDFNAQATSTEIGMMKTGYYDAWAEAAADGTAIDYPGNTRFGATRNSRIDYTFYSRYASSLVLRGAQVYDTRDGSGYMPSDHKPLVTTFDVK